MTTTKKKKVEVPGIIESKSGMRIVWELSHVEYIVGASINSLEREVNSAIVRNDSHRRCRMSLGCRMEYINGQYIQRVEFHVANWSAR